MPGRGAWLRVRFDALFSLSHRCYELCENRDQHMRKDMSGASISYASDTAKIQRERVVCVKERQERAIYYM